MFYPFLVKKSAKVEKKQNKKQKTKKQLTKTGDWPYTSPASLFLKITNYILYNYNQLDKLTIKTNDLFQQNSFIYLLE